jgi:acyl carrier protein
MRRCSEVSVEAALAYQRSRDPHLIAPIVIGVIDRFIEPELRPILSTAGEELRLGEDLRIDSLMAVEIVMVLEEIFEVTVANEDFRRVETLADLRRLCSRYASKTGTKTSDS